MELVNVPIGDIVPYENNPRKNDKAVDIVAKSIKEFGFLVPLVLDDKNIVIAGHTRLKAAIKLGLSQVPVIYTEGLTDAQIKAFRIMDNKSSEYAEWDEELLKSELDDLKKLGVDLELTGFSKEELKLKDLDEFVDVVERSQVIMINPPEAPKLKERESFYFKNIEDYQKVKDCFFKEGKFDEQKLLSLI